jgi:RNA polymerase sigma-70 factor (ECF subfamily)
MNAAARTLPPSSSAPFPALTLVHSGPNGKDLSRLIEAVAQHRDREAFARLFAHFAPRLKSFQLRAGATPAAAEDFAQEAMLTVWRKAALYDSARAGASSWIFAIARNLRIDAHRRDRRGAVEIDVSFEPEAQMQPDRLLSDQDEALRIRQALAALPEEQADVVRLSFYQDVPHAEIAGRLGLPLGTVKSRLRLAMARLREALGDLT